MRYLGVAAVVTALLVFAGSASATTLTSPAGTTLGVGAEIKAESEGLSFHDVEFSLGVHCQKSNLEGTISNAGGSSATASVTLNKWTFTECNFHTVVVSNPGVLEIHYRENGDATLTSTGAVITILTHGTFYGTKHCIYITDHTHLGTITGSSTTKATASIDVGAPLPQSSTDSNCDLDAALTGIYKVMTPDYLVADSPPGTTLTSPAGTTLEEGEIAHAEAGGPITMDGTINVTCQKSTVQWSVIPQGPPVITKGPLAKFTIEECGNHTVSVLKRGSLELHGTGSGNGTMTWSGGEFTILTHSLFLGTRHCVYVTNNTDIGTFTGSKTTKSTATLDVGPAPIPQTATDSLCGNDAEWTGSYKFTSPDYLDVD